MTSAVKEPEPFLLCVHTVPVQSLLNMDVFRSLFKDASVPNKIHVTHLKSLYFVPSC